MSANPGPKRDDYHHRNLAEAALGEALRVLETGEELSMRAIARAIGVAHRALFNHFPDRSVFEAALCAKGFGHLGEALSAASSAAAFIRTYAEFALSRPALYDLMMRQPYAAYERNPALRAAADKVIGVSLKILAPAAENPEAGRRSVMQLWMLVHGGVSLHRSGMLRTRSDDAFTQEMLKIAGLIEPEPEGRQALWPNPEE